MASVIVLTVRAVDMNAVENVREQYDQVEITFFVKPYMNKNPVFTNAGWSADGGDLSTLVVRVDEETPIGTELVQLKASDVLTNESLYDFKAVTAVPRQIAMDYAGKVILTERLDYETLENKVSDDGLLYSIHLKQYECNNGFLLKNIYTYTVTFLRVIYDITFSVCILTVLYTKITKMLCRYDNNIENLYRSDNNRPSYKIYLDKKKTDNFNVI